MGRALVEPDLVPAVALVDFMSAPTPERPTRSRKTALPYIGFARHRPGRIHVYCSRCHRKTSNAERGKYDPPNSVIVATICDRCGHGGKEADETHRDAQGRRLCNLCGRWSCELGQGTRTCDERLIGEPDAD